MDKWSLVCRCEEISGAEVEQAVLDGAQTPDDVKRSTRCAMGYCQAKFCEHLMIGMLASTLGRAGAAWPAFRLRPPVRPFPLGALVDGYLGEGGPELLDRLLAGASKEEK